MRIYINGNVGIGTASCHPNFRCWEIIFTSHRYLLGCSGGVFTGIAQNPWDGDDEILFTSLEKAVDNSRLSIKTIYQCRLSIIDQKKR
jgi:hypothetical protein